jgi:Zn-dependent protease/CBS domain-containing protein
MGGCPQALLRLIDWRSEPGVLNWVVFRKGIRLFNLFGFEVSLDWSWIILAVLITWSLARGVFPFYFRGFAPLTYWWMGAAGAIGLFASIVLHEFGHSLVARAYGIPMHGITLFVFGGVAEMGDEPPNPASEFLMAVAGPATSVLLAGVFYAVSRLGNELLWPVTALGVLGYLAWINIALAAFNMIPAFPLDGGRVLRSALWGWKRNFRWSTRIAAGIGTGFSYLLICFGIASFVFGSFISGIWWFVLGMFLRAASRSSYQQVLLREVLHGQPVQRFMTPNPVTVPPTISVRDLVEYYIYRYHYKMIPVVTDDELLGCVTARKVKELPRNEWDRRTAQDVALPCSPENSIPPNAEAEQAFSMLNRTDAGRLMVVDHGHLVGMVTLQDLMKFISLKVELEGA